MRKRFWTAAAAVVMAASMSLTAFAGEWKKDNVGWWWQNDDGSYPVSCWEWLDGNQDGVEESYCFDANGYMYADTTTPDGYTVNTDGAWVENGAVQTRTKMPPKEQTSAPAAPETTEAASQYDFGGAVVRVSGGIFGSLSDNSEDNPMWDFAHQVEEKYNIQFEYTELEEDEDYSTMDMILAGIDDGEAYADIFCQGDDVVVGLRDYLTDITADVDQLQMGSIYTEAGTWDGHTYGWTYDNMGSVYVMVYSRDFLESIGMDTTPTDLFEQGKWSYKDAIEYLTELKSKLPDGTYPIGVHTNHWVSMAPAANGVVSVDSDGDIHMADKAYCSALDFYKQLLQLGLAYPITDVEVMEGGGISAYQTFGLDTLSTVYDPGTHVITMAEAWQMESLQDSLGEWGIVPWPWDSKYVTCRGNYTNLGKNYKTVQPMWTDVLVPKAEYRAADAKDIPDIVLHLIAKDFVDLCGPAGAEGRYKMWEAESKGEEYVNLGYTPGELGSFCTEQDAEIYDWLHSRVVCDWGHAMNSNGVVLVNRNAAYVIANGDDSQSSGESFTASGDQAMKEQGFK